ncbi:hypothetical protein DSO57_1030274 [Entomophthora muscae]|uniref:Uncharacterized protein n=1 Tax=Entomophthora muscae TaxID=34485 RepID=A0ACC2RS08_9FUNG|nr:hypothetical protein DSO57_1030274 [Entomophthora muscae]
MELQTDSNDWLQWPGGTSITSCRAPALPGDGPKRAGQRTQANDQQNQPLSVRANPKPRTGLKPLHLAAKKKRGRPRKPAGGFRPPANHQGGQGPLKTAQIGQGSLKQPKAGSRPGASFNAGPGELLAPNSIGAPSPNATIGLGAPNAALNQICRMQPEYLINFRFLLLQLQLNLPLFLPPLITPAALMY